MHRIIRKEVAVFLRELRGKSFVVCDYERWFLQLLNYVRRRKGFTRTSHTQKRLVTLTSSNPFHQRSNSLRLIPSWSFVSCYFEFHACYYTL